MIYFARAVEIENAPIKIGFSDDIDRRLEQLEWRYRTPLALLATMPGGREEEKAVHERFAHLRFGTTEQFRPAPELLAFIGLPLLASANPDAVEAMKSHAKPMIAQLRGSEEFKEWVEKVADVDRSPIAVLIEKALIHYSKSIGMTDPAPRR
jgi:hypothetical protein